MTTPPVATVTVSSGATVWPSNWKAIVTSAVEAGPEGLGILVFGAPDLGENPREDVEGQRDWWAD